jgi:hypothetical protein
VVIVAALGAPACTSVTRSAFACEFSREDTEWLASATEAWDTALPRLLSHNASRLPRIVLFSETCVWDVRARPEARAPEWINLGVKFRGETIGANSRPHDGEFVGPDGVARSAVPIGLFVHESSKIPAPPFLSLHHGGEQGIKIEQLCIAFPKV